MTGDPSTPSRTPGGETTPVILSSSPFPEDPTTTTTTPNDNDDSCVQVAVRVRPMLPFEEGSTKCVEVLKSTNSTKTTVVRMGGAEGPKFTFDQAFDSYTTQRDVYLDRVDPLVDRCLEGYNATILAYGQTGSGKTHTIMGPSNNITSSVQDPTHAGVIPRAIQTLFAKLQVMSEEYEEEHKFEYDIRVQFLEVYGDDIRDLLNSNTSASTTNSKLTVRDVGLDEPEVLGATQQKVESPEEALLCLTRGMYRRVTGATAMNSTSSRSHAIFSILVEQSTATSDEDVPSMAKRSKFNFVDLAGSERQKRTQAEGLRLKEGININQGLLVLGNVISALGDPKKKGKTFVPYRDSKLTRLLKGSLGGNHKTLMIACVSPSSNNMEESLNCLRYANRAKNIQNHAVVNVDATSRLVSDLKAKVQTLASDLLQASKENANINCSFPMDVLETLAQTGEGGIGPGTPAPSTPRRDSFYSSGGSSPMVALNMQSSEDLARTQGLLRQSWTEKEHAEEELNKLQAEKEVYRLRLEAISSGDKEADVLQDAFVSRAQDYEREIASLKSALTAQKRSMHHNSPARPSSLGGRLFDKTISHQEYLRLPSLPPRTPGRKTPLSRHLDRQESPELSRLKAQMMGSMSHGEQVDAEVQAEEQAVKNITNRFLRQSRDDLDDDEVDEGLGPVTQDLSQNLDLIHKQHQMETDLLEIDESILAKEELIEQLEANREKYETMREFYEGKLQEMEDLLMEKEIESERLAKELKEMDQGHSGSKALVEQLKQKQQDIAELKNKQRELTRLTSVASRNESQISKLKNEILEAKQRKVNLQKQITDERKQHTQEVQQLKKEAIQKDKELTKVMKMNERKTVQAEVAQQMAKARLEQMNQLKSKYKESEKKLRMQTVKRGVMEKAGLDPVMVGRRETKKKGAASAGEKSNQLDHDMLRDFFDQKVADIGRREALAEKLAQEWEEHLVLTTKRQEFEQMPEVDQEELSSLDSQILAKQERIRQLAARLGKKIEEDNTEDISQNTFLFDKAFQAVVKDTSPMVAVKAAAKVLFGMIVRERRRIATLARTASALDERVQEAEALASSKDAAFRAYVDEQRQEAATSAQNQQEQILSLMNMVREQAPEEESKTRRGTSYKVKKDKEDQGGNPKLLLLANERISALESQLRELHLGHEAVQRHRQMEEEARNLLSEKTHECEDLEEELSDVRSALRQIREAVERESESSGFNAPDTEEALGERGSNSILDIIGQALHPSDSSVGKSKKRKSSSVKKREIASPLTPRLRRHADLMHTSDSETEEVPDWAADIMADLAIIAEGKVPSALLGGDMPGIDSRSSLIAGIDTQAEAPSVFDRLTNPQSFTGVQKNRSSSKSSAVSGQKQRKMISKQVADSLNNIVIPEVPGSEAKTTGRSKSQGNSSRSVFERLQSPSNFTGIQKSKFEAKQGKKGRDSGDGPRSSHGSAQSRKLFEKSTSSPSENEDNLLDDLLYDGDTDEGRSDANASSEVDPSAHSKLNDYTQQDVFERLNKTTTQAYAVKQNKNIAEDMLDHILDEDSSSKLQGSSSKLESQSNHARFERVDEYAQRNVFERLQHTTTQAYATKQNGNIAEKMLGDILDPEQETLLQSFSGTSHTSAASSPPSRSEIATTRQNHSTPGRSKRASGKDVFERLQNTTTEAYMMKKNPPVEYEQQP